MLEKYTILLYYIFKSNIWRCLNIDKNKTLILPTSTIENYIINNNLFNIAVTKVGYYHKAFNHFIRRDSMDECIIIYCIDGEGWLEVNNTKFIITPGEIIYLDKNIPHAYGSKNNNPWSIFWVHFLSEKPNIVSENMDINNSFIVSDIGCNSLQMENFNRILSLIELGINTNIMLQCTSYLNLILCNIHLSHSNDSKKSRYKKDYINLAVKYLESEIYNNITLEEVSSHVNLSKYHFSREFKKATNYTPIEYFNRKKIEIACNLLTTTNLTINEISTKLSYSTPYYFSEYFKEITGFSPSQYKKNYICYY